MPLTCSGGACPGAVGSRGDIVSLQVGSDDSTTGWTHPIARPAENGRGEGAARPSGGAG